MRVDPKVFIVCYDICDSKRLRRVYKTMRGFGEHIQYSVFLCRLAPMRFVALRAALEEIVAPREDQVLLIPLGSVEAGTIDKILAIGRPFGLPLDVARVL
jgi:CRISPR-associated protein Cas2